MLPHHTRKARGILKAGSSGAKSSLDRLRLGIATCKNMGAVAAGADVAAAGVGSFVIGATSGIDFGCASWVTYVGILA